VKEDLSVLRVRNGEELAAYREVFEDIVEAAMGINGPGLSVEIYIYIYISYTYID